MKIKINKDLLRDGIATIRGNIKTSNTMPILSCISMDAMDGKLHLCATDLDCYAKVSLDCEVTQPGQCCIGSTALANIAKIASGDTIIIKHSDGSLDADNGKVKLKTLPFEDMPSFPVKDDADTWDVTHMRESIASVSHASSTDDERRILIGVNIDNDTNVVAVDGRRASFRGDVQPAGEQHVVIPSRVIKMLSLCDESIIIGDKMIWGSGSDAVKLSIAAKPLDGNYPNWRAVVGRGSQDDQFEVPSLGFLSILSNADLMAPSDGKVIVSINAAKASLTVTAQDATCVFSDEIGVTVHNQSDLIFKANGGFLTQAIKSLLPMGDTVSIYQEGEASAIFLTCGDATELIMPMR
jgi:DNA polymerase-3 subunit beta